MSLLYRHHGDSIRLFAFDFDFRLTRKHLKIAAVIADFILIYAIIGLKRLQMLVESYLADNHDSAQGRLKQALRIEGVLKFISLQALSGAIGAAIGRILF